MEIKDIGYERTFLHIESIVAYIRERGFTKEDQNAMFDSLDHIACVIIEHDRGER